MTTSQYPTRVRLIVDRKRKTRPYEVRTYYADGSTRNRGYFKDQALAESEVAYIQSAIDKRRNGE